MYCYCRSGYIPSKVFRGSGLVTLARRMAARIKKSKVRFSGIAFRGISGALVAPLVAAELNKRLIVVRKKSARSHTDYAVEGYVGGHYIIIDDFIYTGATCRAIMKSIKNETDAAKCVGIFLYTTDGGGQESVSNVTVYRSRW